MASYHHGVRVTEINDGPRPIRTVNSGVIGVVITAPKGPVNTPVMIAGSRADWTATFGSGVGTTDQVADAIFDQIGALCVVVNVLDPAVHKAAVAAVEYTFDTTTDTLEVADDYVSNVAVTSTDATPIPYTLGDDYTYDSDTGVITRVETGAIATGQTVKVAYDRPDAAGVTNTDVIGEVDAVTGQHKGILALEVAKSTLGVKPRIIGAPLLDTQPVATELAAMADKLKAFTYVHADGAETYDAALAYRNNFGNKRVMVLWPEFTGYDVSTESTVTVSAVGRALGLRAKIDNEMGWHKTLSNIPVNGVTGLNKDVSWDLLNPNTTAGLLNAGDVTTLINEKGFRFWGSRTCSADPLFAFESATRTGDILADTIAEAHLWAIDKPMSKTLINDIVEGVNAKFRELKANGYIIDANAWINPELNTEQQLADGQLNISYDYTPVPPLEQLNFNQKITTSYLVQLLAA